eukprot:1664292-Ditylum_brightwellii.AAC.1
MHEIKQNPSRPTGSQLHVVNCFVEYVINENHLTWEEHAKKALQIGSTLASVNDEYGYGRLRTSLKINQAYWLGDGTAWNTNEAGSNIRNLLSEDNGHGDHSWAEEESQLE